MAFGIEAWWGERQDALHRVVLLEDLQVEIARNRDALDETLGRQRLRAQRLDLILGELVPDGTPLGGDSVRALQRSVLNNPTYDPGFGVLNLLIQSGDLALVENRVLRARLAGLDAFLDDYLGNQALLVDFLLQPDVLFGTGSIVFDYSAVVPGDLTLTTASEEVRHTAGKFLTVTLGVTNLLIGQGDALLAELTEIMALLQQA